MSTGKPRGFIAVPREIFDNAIFAAEPFTEVQAFLGLVADAGWKPRRVRLARGAVDLERGQLLASTRFLAERWQWPEPRVRRFLNRLSGRRANDAQNDAPNDAQKETQFDALIDAQPTRDGTIITIRNYDAFQKTVAPDDDRFDAQNDAQKETQPDARNDAPLDSKSTQRERNNNINNYIPLSEESGVEREATGSNVVTLSKSRAVAVQSAPTIPEPDGQTPAGVVFSDCRKYLQRAADLTPDGARRMLGRWCKTFTHGEVIDAVSKAQREGAVDPVPFITQCLKQRRKPDQRPSGAMSAIAAMEGVKL